MYEGYEKTLWEFLRGNWMKKIEMMRGFMRDELGGRLVVVEEGFEGFEFELAFD